MTRGRVTGNDDTPDDGPVRGRSDPVGAALADLVRETRTDDAAAGRRRAHWIRTQARAGATFTGVLREFARTGTVVTLGTAEGIERTGELLEVGADVVVMATSDGAHRLLPLARVGWVLAGGAEVLGVDERSSDDLTDDAGDLGRTGGTELRSMLASWADDQLPVRLLVAARSFAGELRWVGLDVAAVGSDTPGAIAYVRLSSLAEASLNVSG